MLECLIKSFRLACLKIIFGINNGAWKCYLLNLLEGFGFPIFFHFHYDIKDYSISFPFYCELLQWWSDFRQEFATGHDWKNILSNNKEIRVNKLPIFYKGLFDSDIIYVKDLSCELSTTDSFNIISKKIAKSNFLVWAGLRHSIPSHLKTNNTAANLLDSPSLMIGDAVFDVLEKNAKDYYASFISTKAQYLNNAQNLKHELSLTDNQLVGVFKLPHNVSPEPYDRAFQYKVLKQYSLYQHQTLQDRFHN